MKENRSENGLSEEMREKQKQEAQSSGKNIFARLLPLVNLLPAALVIVMIASALPATKPVLREIPELLTIDAQASETEAQNEQEKEDKDAEKNDAKGNFEDGVYKGTGTGYGGTITVEVTVKDKSIVSIEILSAPGETASFLKRAEAVIDSVIASQTWEVDVVSGATYSSKGILAAVKNALTGEKTETETAPVQETKALEQTEFEEPQGYTDGTYYGQAQGFGGTIQVKVVISEGSITDIAVVSASGETPSYLSSAKAVISRILAAQSPNVDTVSGATYSSNGIINAVKKALSQAAGSGVKEDLTVTEAADSAGNNQAGTSAAGGASSQSKPAVTNKPVVSADGYKDGTYTGTGEGFGGDIKVQVTVKNGKITSIDILSAEDETPSFLKQARGVIDRILAAQSTSVDVVSGATYSSEGIIYAVSEALEKAMPEEKPETENTENTEGQPAAGSPEKPEEEPETGKPESSGEQPETGSTEPTEEQPETGGTEKDGENQEQPGTDEPLTGYIDGIYQAAALCTEEDTFLYTVQTTVTIFEGRITEIDVQKLDDRSDDPDSNDSYLNYAINGRTRKNIWYEGVVKQILTAQNADNVDAVSSATYSSNAITEAVKESLIQALPENISEDELPEAVLPENIDESGQSKAELPENTAESESPEAALPESEEKITLLLNYAADLISTRRLF